MPLNTEACSRGCHAHAGTPFSGQVGDALSLPYLLSSITKTEHDIQSTLDTVGGDLSSFCTWPPEVACGATPIA